MSTFLFARLLTRLFFTNCKWCKPNNFVMAALVIVLWINPVIIILWNICMQSSFRLPVVKMLVHVIFYCQNLMQQAVIINYRLKMFTLRNTAKIKKHMILGRLLSIQYLVWVMVYMVHYSHMEVAILCSSHILALLVISRFPCKDWLRLKLLSLKFWGLDQAKSSRHQNYLFSALHPRWFPNFPSAVYNHLL